MMFKRFVSPFFCASLLFALATYPTVSTAAEVQLEAQAEAAALDFAAINASVAEALEEFSAQSDWVESLQYSFNAEETNIAEDNYVLDLSLATKDAPWSDQRMVATGRLGMKVNKSREPQGGIVISVDATNHTDALAMLKYKVTKISNCAAEMPFTGVMKVFWNRHCEYVYHLEDIKTVAELHDMLQAKLSDHNSDLAEYIASLRQGLASLQSQQQSSSAAVSLLEAEVEKAQTVASFIGKIDLQRTEEGFSLEAPAFTECPFFGSTGVKLTVAPETVHFKGDIEIKFGQQLYSAAKPVFIEILRGLEKKEPYALKFVQLDAEVFVNLITEM